MGSISDFRKQSTPVAGSSISSWRRQQQPLSTPTRTSLFNSLPDFLKAGWNQSITGMIAEKAFGGTQLKLKDEDLSTIEQVGATLSSFIPDFWTLAIGGWAAKGVIGTARVTGITSKVTAQLIKKGISKETAKQIATKGVQGAITSASQLGVYGGASSTMSQLLYSGQVDPVKVGGDILKMSTLGAMAGGTGGFLAKVGLPAQIFAESGVFAFGGAGMEGRLPKLEDFAHSLGVIGALKGYGRITSARRFAKEKKATQFDLTEEGIRQKAKDLTDRSMQISVDTYISPQGKTIRPFFRKGKVHTVEEGQKKVYTEEEFLKTHTKSKEAGGTPREIEKHRFKMVHIFGRELNLIKKKTETRPATDKLYRDKMEAFTGKRSVKDLTAKQLSSFKDLLDKELRYKHYYDVISKAGKNLPNHITKKDSFWSLFKEGFKSAEKRIDHTLEGRVGIDKFYRSYGLEDVHRANLMGLQPKSLRLFRILETLTPKRGIARGEEMSRLAEQKGITTPLNEWYDSMYNYLAKEFKRLKQPIPERIEDYFPHHIKFKLREKFSNDLLNIRGTEFDLLMDKSKFVGGKGERKQLSDQVEYHMRGKFSSETNKALSSLVKYKWIERDGKRVKVAMGEARDYYEALKMLQQEVFRRHYTVSGVEKHRRKPLLPREMYETDARVVTMEYIAKNAKRLAQIEEFGAKGEKMTALIEELHKKDPKASQILAQAYMARTGLIELDPKHNYSPKFKDFWNNVMAFEVGTKIGMGFATIPNTTQTFISTIPHVGFLRSAKTALILMSPTETGRQLRKQAFPAGMYNQMSRLFGIEHPTMLTGFAQWTQLLSGFTAINKFNAIYASANIQVAVKDWAKMAQKKGFQGRWAKDKLNSLDVDPSKPITNRVLTQAGLRFARSTQLQKHVMRDPQVMNDPRWKPFLLFKRFGYGQAKLIKDMLTDEWRRGRLTVLMPALRLAAGGLLGGEFVIWARDKIKSALGGEEFYREDEVMWKKFIENFSAVGAIGMVSDIMTAENITSSVGFVIKPVPFSDIEVIWKSLTAFEKDARKFGLWEDATYIRGAYNVTPIMGGMARQVRKRFEQPGHKIERIKILKGHKKNEVFDLMLKGQSRLAVTRILKWNQAHPENPITAADVSYKALSRREKERLKRRLNP